MHIVRTLFIGKTPPGMTDETLLKFIFEYATEYREKYESYGVVMLYDCLAAQYVESYEEFKADITIHPMTASKYYENVKTHFLDQHKKVRDLRFAVNC
jgi:hypothetical protein